MGASRHRSGPGRLTRLTANFFQLHLDELPRVAWMFCYSLLAVGAFILGRILQDALLLTLPRSKGKDMILLLMGISAIVVSASTYIYSRYANVLRRDKMIIRINGVLAGATFFVYLLIVALPSNIQYLAVQLNYVLVEIMGSLQVILFWTMASELFNPRAAKRSFAIIGGGAVLANLLAFIVRPAVALLGGAHHLMLLLVGMLGLCTWVVYQIGLQNQKQLEHLFAQKQQGNVQRRKGQQIDMGADTERIWSNRHLTTVALVIFVTFVTTTIINYLFKAINADYFQSDRNGLANFLGMFYGISGIIACVLQFALANRLLQHFGIRVALLLLPLTLLFCTGLLGVAPLILSVFWASTMMKGSENVLRYTIYEVSMNLLYVPVDSRLRARAKAFIDGILKPSSIALSALLCALLSYWGWKERHFGWLVVVLLSGWVALLFLVYREYVATLLRSMQTRRLDLAELPFTIKDESALRALRQTLLNGQTEQILHAMELLPHVRNYEWNRELLQLLEHEDERVQTQALRLLADLETQSASMEQSTASGYQVFERESEMLEGKLYSLIQEGSTAVRAQAVLTLCSLLKADAVKDVAPYLEDESPEVRAAAIVGLIRYGELDGVLYAAEPLRCLLENESAEARLYGAQIVGRLGTRSFYRPLLRLLKDQDHQVRIGAIEAAGLLGSEQLLDGLVEALNEPKVALVAARALVRYGAPVLPQMQSLLDDVENPSRQLAAIRVCRQLGGSEALGMLEDVLWKGNREVRQATLKAMQRIMRLGPELRCNEARLLELLTRELKRYYQWATDRDVLNHELSDVVVLIDAIDERQKWLLQEVFLILDLLYPTQQVELIHHHLFHGDAVLRANAIELLDNFLSQDLKRGLFPILEEGYMHSGELLVVLPEPLDKIFTRLASDTSPWMRSCFLWTIANNRLVGYRSFVEKSQEDLSALVRETACFAMRVVAPRENYQAFLLKHRDDSSLLVKRYARFQLAQLDESAL